MICIALSTGSAFAASRLIMTQDDTHKAACAIFHDAVQHHAFDTQTPLCRRRVSFAPGKSFPGVSFPARNPVAFDQAKPWLEQMAEVWSLRVPGGATAAAKSNFVREGFDALRDKSNALSLTSYDFDGDGKPERVLLLDINNCVGGHAEVNFSTVPYPLQGANQLQLAMLSASVAGDPINIDGQTFVSYWKSRGPQDAWDEVALRPAKLIAPSLGNLVSVYPDETCSITLGRSK